MSGCMVVDWGKKGLEGKAASLINLMRKRGLEMPIMILVRRKRFEDIPVEVLDFIDGYVFLAEETPEFIAKNLVSRLKQYAETLKTPFFGFIIAIVGCHFGLHTRGGTEGVGASTTRTVVVVSIAILVADLILTKLFIAVTGGA